MLTIVRLAVAALLLIAPARADQNTVTPIPSAPLTMATLATFLNNAFLSIGSCYSGTSAPAVFSGAAKAYQCWVDTTSTTPAIIKMYDGTDWIQTGTLNVTTNAYVPGNTTTGTGSTVVLSTAPTLTTSATVPLVIGGTGVGSTLTLKSTSGAGSTDAIIFQVGNNGAVEGMRVVTGGQVILGNTSAVASISGIQAPLQVHTTSVVIPILASRWSATTGGPSIILQKSRSGTVGTFTIVQSGDTIGAVDFFGANGTSVTSAANIVVEVDGTPGAADMPGRMIFSTTTDGSATPSERMRISATGQVNVATTTDSTTSTTGALITAGGLGVAKAIYGGTTIYSNSATVMLGSKTTITGGATGNVPTLLAGPVTGEPTKWLPYDDNGTTRYIPSW